MKLTIEDLKEYAKMNATDRNSERGKAIRAELDERMRWMPRRWRRVIRCRFIQSMSVTRTAIEICVNSRTVVRWTREIAEWLYDTDKYLNEQT